MAMFEAHITIHPDEKPCLVPGLLQALQVKFSQISGDEVLGDQIQWCYLTWSGDNIAGMLSKMQAICLTLEDLKLPWKRRKIESILLDERYPT